MITKKFGVKAGYITDYETLVKYLSELLWEIDPHYLKLKKRGMSCRNSRKNLDLMTLQNISMQLKTYVLNL